MEQKGVLFWTKRKGSEEYYSESDSTYIAEYGKQFFEGKLFKPKKEVQKQIEAKLRIREDFYS